MLCSATAKGVDHSRRLEDRLRGPQGGCDLYGDDLTPSPSVPISCCRPDWAWLHYNRLGNSLSKSKRRFQILHFQPCRGWQETAYELTRRYPLAERHHAHSPATTDPGPLVVVSTTRNVREEQEHTCVCLVSRMFPGPRQHRARRYLKLFTAYWRQYWLASASSLPQGSWECGTAVAALRLPWRELIWRLCSGRRVNTRSSRAVRGCRVPQYNRAQILVQAAFCWGWPTHTSTRTFSKQISDTSQALCTGFCVLQKLRHTSLCSGCRLVAKFHVGDSHILWVSGLSGLSCTSVGVCLWTLGLCSQRPTVWTPLLAAPVSANRLRWLDLRE